MNQTPCHPAPGVGPHATPAACSCGLPARRGGLCVECRRRLRRQVEELPGLWRELKTAEVKLSRFGATSEITVHDATSRPLPFDEHAGTHARLIASELSRLAHTVQGGRFRLVHPQVAVSVILAHLGRLVARPDVQHTASVVGSLYGRAVRLVDTPSVRVRFEVGPCPETSLTTDGGILEHCVGDVWALIPADEDQRPVLQCNTCEAQWTPEQWSRAGVRIAGERARRDQVAALAASIVRRGVA